MANHTNPVPDLLWDPLIVTWGIKMGEGVLSLVVGWHEHVVPIEDHVSHQPCQKQLGHCMKTTQHCITLIEDYQTGGASVDLVTEGVRCAACLHWSCSDVSRLEASSWDLRGELLMKVRGDLVTLYGHPLRTDVDMGYWQWTHFWVTCAPVSYVIPFGAILLGHKQKSGKVFWFENIGLGGLYDIVLFSNE